MDVAITEETQKHIPPLYETYSELDPWVHAKLSSREGKWTFYVIEYDASTRMCFGKLVDEGGRNLVYRNADQLLSGAGGVIEHDWKVCRMSLCE